MDAQGKTQITGNEAWELACELFLLNSHPSSFG